jgi:hypothetical protein
MSEKRWIRDSSSKLRLLIGLPFDASSASFSTDDQHCLVKIKGENLKLPLSKEVSLSIHLVGAY